MKKVVSFSGGRTSAFLCKLMIDSFGRENVDFIYMDTGAEHPKTYEFIRNVNREFGLNLVCLRLKINPELGSGNDYEIVDINDLKPDLNPFAAMMSKYGVPYTGGMFCTDRMKLSMFTKYCVDTYGKFQYETYLGIRADEPARIWGDHKQKKYSVYRQLLDCGFDNEEMVSMWKNYCDMKVLRACDAVSMYGIDHHLARLMAKRFYTQRIENEIHYMAEISDADKQDVLNAWSKMPFDLDLPEWLGNCVFCPKKSNLKLAAAQRDEPEMYIEFLNALHSPAVRIDDKTGSREKMYRGEQSLENLIATFDGSTGDEIKHRMRGAKMMDTGSCSESCEVFSCAI